MYDTCYVWYMCLKQLYDTVDRKIVTKHAKSGGENWLCFFVFTGSEPNSEFVRPSI